MCRLSSGCHFSFELINVYWLSLNLQYLDIIILSQKDPKWIDPGEYLLFRYVAWLLPEHLFLTLWIFPAVVWQCLPLKSNTWQDWGTFVFFAIFTSLVVSFHPATGVRWLQNGEAVLLPVELYCMDTAKITTACSKKHGIVFKAAFPFFYTVTSMHDGSRLKYG